MAAPGSLESRYLRQMDLLPPSKLTFPVTVIGAGAIGSAAVIALAKMGCGNVTVWDDDLLEEKNIPNQFCTVSAVGVQKVDALADLARQLSEVEITRKAFRYTGQSLQGLVIAGPDNMEARKSVWKRVRYSARVPLYIDARMGAELARIYAIRPADPDHVSFYESNLYDDAERLPCSARAIIYCPLIVGGLIALMVKKYAIGEPCPREIIFDLPTLGLTVTA